MTTVTTSNMFFLGNLVATDAAEGDFISENAGAILGAYSKPPIVEITNVDVNDDGGINSDDSNPSGDYVTYDAGAGSTSQVVDSVVYYSADVLLGDGSTLNMTVMVIQMQNGDAFAVDISPDDFLENQSIQSITLTSVGQNDFNGYWSNSTVNGASTVCFCAGTKIATPNGEKSVETLGTGDLVLTLDHGPQPVIWTNSTTLLRPGRYAPIKIRPGTLRDRKPDRTLALSPQHRVLVRSKIAQRIAHSPEVLIPAKDLLPLDGADKALPFLPVTYVHFACSNHEIVFANGAEVETFLLGPQGAGLLRSKTRNALLETRHSTQPVRPILQGHKAHALVRRHAAHARPLCACAESVL